MGECGNELRRSSGHYAAMFGKGALIAVAVADQHLFLPQNAPARPLDNRASGPVPEVAQHPQVALG